MPNNLNVTQPYAGCVYQCGTDNKAIVPIAGTVVAGVTNVSATFTPVDGRQLAAIVQTVPVDKAGNFGGIALLPGGDYKLVVSSGTEKVELTRIGAGDVYMLFGHSYIQGGHDQSHQLPATDERVRTLLDMDGEARAYKFGKLVKHIGPFHGDPDGWGQLGDKIVKRTGRPVLFYGCGYGGSNIKQSYMLLKGIPRDPERDLPPGVRDASSRQPIKPVEDVMNVYAPKTGLRAILMQHGYNDRNTPTATFVERFKFVMDYVRNNWQRPNLSIVLVQEQLQPVANSLYDVPTAQGLQQLINSYNDTSKGPDFNSDYWLAKFPAAGHDHLYGEMLDQFAADWDESLGSAFYENSTPYLSTQTFDIFPAVLYQAAKDAGTNTKVGKWFLLGGFVACCLAVSFVKSKKWQLGLIALVFFALSQFQPTNSASA